MTIPVAAPPLRRRPRRPRFRTRPFFLSTALILALAALHTLVPRLVAPSRLDAPLGVWRRDDQPPGQDLECRLVHQAEDQCAFVMANCEDEAAGLLPYITFYYCTMQHVQPLAFGVLVVWLGLLFTTIGIAASDFFSVNLGTIASILGLSESLAGVTFLAFGNGSPDVFSTFAAMGSNSGSMAVGELIGAAGFITGVVAGSMALVREFKVSHRTFVRDICFFIASVAFAMVFLADQSLVLWECCVMIGFYVFYVLTVVGWHWVSTRRKMRRAREAASRGHFYGATVGAIGDSSAGDEDLAPYHDDLVAPLPGPGGEVDPHDEPEPDDTAPVGGRRERPPPDITALERGPRIDIDSVDSPPGEADLAFDAEAQDRLISDEEQDRRNRHINAEMTSSMRVNRPRGVRRTTITTPIRPSLLGALEFRSVLASLQRSGTMHLAPIDPRRPAGHRPSLTQRHSVSAVVENGASDNVRRSEDSTSRSSLLPHAASNGRDGRERAFSSGDQPFHWEDRSAPLVPPLLRFTDADETLQGDSAAATASSRSSLGPSPGESVATSGTASPEAPFALSPSDTPTASPPPPSVPTSSIPQQHPSRLPPGGGPLRLVIPSSPQQGAGPSPQASPALSPFPGYTESPLPFSPLPPPRAPVPNLPLRQPSEPAVDDGSSFPGLDDNSSVPKPIRWWPYHILPSPHVIAYTLFPSLVGWREKTIWDKFVSLISAPTVLLLVTTLPVVEIEIQSDEDDEDDDLADVYAPGDGLAADGEDDVHEPLINGPHGPAGSLPENEWQRYRRSTLTGRPTLPAVAAMQEEATGAGPDTMSLSAVSMTSADSSTHNAGSVPGSVPAAAFPVPGKPQDAAVLVSESSRAEAEALAAGWNRWLVAVQLFTGPLFTVFIVWANMAEELEQPGRDLVFLVLGSLAASGAMLVVLLWTTTAQRRPKYHSLLCFLGFVISVAWISTVAGEVVGVLKAIGVIVGISDAILGLTIFAMGNSLGDLVADVTVARLGYPVMALAACFGGPMLNILLGVGIGGAWMTIKAARDQSKQHPGQPLHYEPYPIEVGGTLLVSAATVLLSLVFLLVAVPANRWVMSRKIGVILIGMWAVSTVLNVILEVTGVWS